MTAHELGQRVDNDVDAEFDRPQQNRGGDGVVHHQGDTVGVRDFGQ